MRFKHSVLQCARSLPVALICTAGGVVIDVAITAETTLNETLRAYSPECRSIRLANASLVSDMADACTFLLHKPIRLSVCLVTFFVLAMVF